MPDTPVVTDPELRRLHLFAGLSDDQLARARQGVRLLNLDEGDPLFRHGEAAERFFLVRSGQIKLFRLAPDGTEKIIEIISAGQTFAEAVMFMKSQRYPVSAEALAPSVVVAFDNRAFMAVLHDSVDTCFRVIGDMSMRLHQLLGEIDALTLQNASLRLVNYLLYQIPEGATAPVAIQLTAPKNVIASRLSIQPETLSRIFANLTRAGLITVDGRTVHVHDLAGLRACAQ